MHYFIHGKIYFIVDEIDSCETIYSTKEGGPEHTASIMPKLNLSVLLKLWWTVFGRVGPILAIKTSPGGTIFAAKIGPPGPVLGGPILL